MWEQHCLHWFNWFEAAVIHTDIVFTRGRKPAIDSPVLAVVGISAVRGRIPAIDSPVLAVVGISAVRSSTSRSWSLGIGCRCWPFHRRETRWPTSGFSWGVGKRQQVQDKGMSREMERKHKASSHQLRAPLQERESSTRWVPWEPMNALNEIY